MQQQIPGSKVSGPEKPSPKSKTQMPSPLFPGARSQIPGLRTNVSSPSSQIPGHKSQFSGPCFHVPRLQVPEHQVSGPRFPVYTYVCTAVTNTAKPSEPPQTSPKTPQRIPKHSPSHPMPPICIWHAPTIPQTSPNHPKPRHASPNQVKKKGRKETETRQRKTTHVAKRFCPSVICTPPALIFLSCPFDSIVSSMSPLLCFKSSRY